MHRSLKNFFSPATVIALLALVVALGGTSFAAAQLSSGAHQRVAPGQPTLASGASMVGYFAAGSGESSWLADSITFPKKLPSSFNQSHVKYLTSGSSYTTKCPGPGKAAKGWMCFYEGQSSNASLCCIYNQHYDDPAVAPYGARIYWSSDAGSSSYADGQWVVRAP